MSAADVAALAQAGPAVLHALLAVIVLGLCGLGVVLVAVAYNSGR